MIYYLDTSAWAKRYFAEKGSAYISQIWLANERFACSGIGLVEIIAAISRRYRDPSYPPGSESRVISQAYSDYSDFLQIDIAPVILSRAAQLAETHKLRAADAVHLASTIDLRNSQPDPILLITSDQELFDAAVIERIAAINPEHVPP